MNSSAHFNVQPFSWFVIRVVIEIDSDTFFVVEMKLNDFCRGNIFSSWSISFIEFVPISNLCALRKLWWMTINALQLKSIKNWQRQLNFIAVPHLLPFFHGQFVQSDSVPANLLIDLKIIALDIACIIRLAWKLQNKWFDSITERAFF